MGAKLTNKLRKQHHYKIIFINLRADINRMYDDGDDYTTEFVIYPPRLQDGFFRIELEVYA